MATLSRLFQYNQAGGQQIRAEQNADLTEQLLDGEVSVSVASGNVTLSLTPYDTAQVAYGVVRITGAPGTSRIVTIPSGYTGRRAFFNVTTGGYDITVKVASGSLSVTLPVNTLVVVYTDGTEAYLAVGAIATAVLDTDGTLAANSDLRVATQKATKTYVDSVSLGLLDDKGNIDCSANPNYPTASKGDVYTVSVAGRIGGASGAQVDIGDMVRATADNAGGTQAAVGTSWAIVERNLIGALSASDIGVTVQAYSANLDTYATIAPSANVQTLLGSADYAAFRSSLSLVPGTNVQAYDATLTSIAALGTAADKIAYTTGVDTWAETGLTAAARSVLDDTTVAAMLTTLGGASLTANNALTGTQIVTYNATNPVTTTRIESSSQTNSITSNNANVQTGISSLLRMNQNGFNQTGSLDGFSATVYASGASGTVSGLRGFASTVGNIGAGTLTTAQCFIAGSVQNTGGGTVGTFIGFNCSVQTDATTVYGFLGQVAAGSGRWNNYHSGTAPNYFRGNTGIGPSMSTANAYLHLGAGTTAANTSPIQFTSGPPETTPRAGCVNFETDDLTLVITTGAARKKFVLDDGTALVSGRVSYNGTNGRQVDSSAFTYAAGNLGVSRLTVLEQATPSTPASGYGCFYAGTDSKPYFINDSGTATDLTAGGGGATFSGAKVYNNANISRSNGDYSTYLAMNSEDFDTDAFHNNSTNNSRITIPTTGYYMFGFSVRYAANGSGNRLTFIDLNGTATGICQTSQVAHGADALTHAASALRHFTAGDYFELCCYQTSGGNLDVQYVAGLSPLMWIYKVG